MAGEYDKILRENFRTPKTNLLRQLIPDEIVSIQPLVPKLQHTVLERETDTIAEVLTEEEKRFIIHIEWQSSNDPQMASRMAMYDLLLYQAYAKEVMGVVLYVGNDKMRMKDTLSFFDFHYSCRIIDVRLLDPETFLDSDDPGEIIFAILAGKGDTAKKTEIVQKIFFKLQKLFEDDVTTLQVKIRQLEFLSLLRGEDIQKIITEEELKMPVFIDYTKDIRYKQGIEVGMEKGKEVGIEEGKEVGIKEGKEVGIKEGMEKGIEEGMEKKAIDTARKMFENGLDISIVQNVTGLNRSRLEEIAKGVFKD